MCELLPAFQPKRLYWFQRHGEDLKCQSACVCPLTFIVVGEPTNLVHLGPVHARKQNSITDDCIVRACICHFVPRLQNRGNMKARYRLFPGVVSFIYNRRCHAGNVNTKRQLFK